MNSLTDTALDEKLPEWGVLVLESHHSPQFTMEWRSHLFIKVVYVLHGSGTFHLDRKKLNFSAGDVVVVPPGVRNRIDDDPVSASSLYVGCVDANLLTFDPRLNSLVKGGLIRDEQFANRVASLFRRMVHTQDHRTRSRSIAMVSDALRLIKLTLENQRSGRAVGKQSTSHERLVAQYIQALDDEFYEATTIDDAAEQLGIPRRSFTKLFAQQTQMTWLQYVRKLGIQHAQDRLRNTNLPIASVAFECGFNDLSTFYRQFKAQVGVSPAKYRDS